MFGWFYDFLYSITKTLLRLIDGLIVCANMLCGIEPINFDGEQTDFLSYLLFSDKIGFAFRISAVIATVLLVIFTVFMIIRSIVKEKAEGTPAQIAVKALGCIRVYCSGQHIYAGALQRYRSGGGFSRSLPFQLVRN